MSGRPKLRRGARFFRGRSEEASSSSSRSAELSEQENPDSNGYVTRVITIGADVTPVTCARFTLKVTLLYRFQTLSSEGFSLSGCTSCIWKFPGQGSNLHRNEDNARPQWELLSLNLFFLKYN